MAFEHGHGKHASIPESHVIQQDALKRACEMQQHVPSETASSAAIPHADEATDAAATTETGAASPRAEHAGNTYAVDLMTTYS